MSHTKRKKREFLRQHPICCFCGGEALATSLDHIPARAFFLRREWPEGFLFPACKSCNSSTSQQEQIAALICRANPFQGAEHQSDFARMLSGIHNNNPGLLESMFPSVRTIRRFLRDRDYELAAGQTTKDVGVMSLDDPEIHNALNVFARKLVLALHYKHAQQILSCSGRMLIRSYSNVDLMDGAIPTQAADLINEAQPVFRNNRYLHDQFDYRYRISPELRLSAFFATFGRSMAFLGTAFWDGEPDWKIGDDVMYHGVFGS